MNSTAPNNNMETGEVSAAAVAGNPRLVLVWVVGAVFGVVAAACHVLVPEQGLTLLWVMFSTMILGFWAPVSPWRWILLVGLLVPAAAVFQKIMHPAQIPRAEVYGSFLALLPGVVGSYGGAFMRRMVQNIFLKKGD